MIDRGDQAGIGARALSAGSSPSVPLGSHPYPSEIANEAIIPNPIVYLDQTKRLLYAPQRRLGLLFSSEPDPQSINASAIGQAQQDPVWE